MAKIGIITYHFVPNYGAAMQAWALQKHLKELGHNVFIIDYQPSHLTTGGHFRWPKDAWARRANLVIAYLKVMTFKQKVFGDGGKRRRFNKFHREFLNIAPPTYRTNKDLRARPPEADAYICGSDQIWNASEQYGIDPSYFLDFAPSGIKRIAYAASFGRPKVHKRFEASTAAQILEMDSVSVREQSGVDIVRSLCNREAAWVPDPTLLVQDGFPEAISPEYTDGDYIFSYTLRSRDLVGQVEDEMAKQTGLTVISPATLATSGAGPPGPLEWLGLIKSSKYVITNSYHGTLFSIIFRKPFVFVGLSGAKAEFNERVYSLLFGLSLQDHMMSSFNPSKLQAIIGMETDWEQVNNSICQWRESAEHFFRESINSNI